MSKPVCFVMMPFSDRFQGYYTHIFSPVLHQVGLLPVKVDEIYTPTQISHDIFELIQKAEIILADVTGKNANVNYELGIAHALGKKTVIITQSENDVPFDYKHLRYIQYDTSYAEWERKLAEKVKKSVQSTLNMNTPSTYVTGDKLTDSFTFLQDTALDASYEISKNTIIESDLEGNCHVRQDWTIKARSDLSHFIHGVVGDEAGAIHLLRSYDKTNGIELKSLTSIGTEKRARYIIFLSKMLMSGESLSLDLEYTAENYLSHLFSKGAITMFQRSNSKRGVFYNSRKDVYIFPESDFTRKLTAKSDGSITKEIVDTKIDGGKVTVSIDLTWSEPYSGVYSYKIS